MKHITTFSIYILSLLTISFSVYCHAQQDVYYAGVSYLGQYNLLNENYPQALRLNKASPIGKLDQEMKTKIQQSQQDKLNIIFGLADYRNENNVVLSLGIEKEYLSHERIGNKQKLIAKVSAQLLLFDYKEGNLLASIPVAIARNHVQRSKTSIEETKAKLFTELYLGSSNEQGLLDLAVTKIPELLSKRNEQLRFQVSKVSLSSNIVERLPLNYSENSVKQYIGQYFTARLAASGKVSVLPYVRGAGFGKKMAGRFSNGDVFNLALPQPDYEFALELSNLQKAPMKEDMLFACRLHVNLDEPFSEKTIFSDYIHYAVAKLISPNHKQIDEWAAYQDAIEVLLDDFILQLSNPQKSWIKKHSDSRSLYRQLKKHKKLFN